MNTQLINNMFAPAMYKEGDSKESVQRSYVKTTGIYQVTLESINAYVNKNGTSSNVIFTFITAENQIIVVDTNYMYTDKQSKKLTDGLGSRFIQTLLRFKNPDKTSSSALWTPTKFKHFGKDVDGQKMELGSLKLQVYVTNTRSSYEKATGELVATSSLAITRLFTKDGLTQTELEAVKRGEDIEIKHLTNAKKFLKKKVEDGASLHNYSKIDEQEWLDINEVSNSSSSSKSKTPTEPLPDLDLDTDLDADVETKPKEVNEVQSPKEDTEESSDFLLDGEDFNDLL